MTAAEVVNWPSEPRYQRIIITPETAVAMLATNTHNRKMANATVARYAAMMRLGQWRPTMADPITFDRDGVLQDGQHRLQAIVESGVETEVWVAYGADPADFHVIGTGKRRSVSDVLGMAGYTHVNVRAAAARQVLSYDRIPGRVWNSTVALAEGITEVTVADEAMRSEYEAAIPLANQARRHTNLINPTTVVAHCVLVMRYSQRADDLGDFTEHLASGAGLDVGNPILTLRNWYLGDNARAGAGWGTWGGQRRLAIHTRAWNAWVDGEPLKQLKFNQQNLPMPGVK